MREKEDLKTLANAHREVADVIEKMADNEDPEKEEELAGMFMAKIMKIQRIQQRL